MDRLVVSGKYGWVLRAVGSAQQSYFEGEPTNDSTPRLRINIDDRDGRFVLGEVRVFPARNADAGVTSADMRALPLARLLAAARQDVAEQDPAWAANRGTTARLRRELERAKRKELPPSGRRGLPDAHFKRLALLYLRLAETEHMTKRIVARIAEQEGRSPATVSGWIVEARRRQYLSPGVRGRAGAAAGPNLFEQEENL